MNDDRLELIVDNEDSYQGLSNVFYINPNRLPLVRCLGDNQFVHCQIKNTPVDVLTSLNFSFIARKLQPQAQCEVIIQQPITVMQEYDAKQVEANAKLAGFTDFETSSVELVDNQERKYKTLVVTCTKPVRAPRSVEVVVSVQERVVPATKQSNSKARVAATTVTTTTRTTSKNPPPAKKR